MLEFRKKMYVLTFNVRETNTPAKTAVHITKKPRAKEIKAR